jgi:hypothetical protein
MRSVLATLVVKFLVIAVLLALILPATSRVHWSQALWIAVVVTAVTYVVGDRLVLRTAGNAATVLVDFGLAVLLVWFGPRYAPGAAIPFGAALVAGGAVAVGEILFHQFLLERGVGVR